MREVFKFRDLKANNFKLPTDKVHKFEYLPWTAAATPNGIRDNLLHIINIITKHGVQSTAEPELRQQHFKNLVELVDFYLDGRKAYLESIKEMDKYDTLLRKYESERGDLIFHFGKYLVKIVHFCGFIESFKMFLQLTVDNLNWQQNWLKNI